LFSRNGSSGSTGGASGSRDTSPAYQNWSHVNNVKEEQKSSQKTSTNNTASDCTSSTECSNSGADEDSDRNSEDAHNNVNVVTVAAEKSNVYKATPTSKKRPGKMQVASVAPTPAPRTTLELKPNNNKCSSNSSTRSVSVERSSVKQVRHESLV
jgi:hypothetical protein